MKENEVFAVKRGNKWFAAIDCGPTKTGGFTVGNFWNTHFKHDGHTYRYYSEIFNAPDTLQEWQKIKVITKDVTVLANSEYHIAFEGFEDCESKAFEPFVRFAALLGKSITIEQARDLINNTTGK